MMHHMLKYFLDFSQASSVLLISSLVLALDLFSHHHTQSLLSIAANVSVDKPDGTVFVKQMMHIDQYYPVSHQSSQSICPDQHP